jgi:hypothetical protein
MPGVTLSRWTMSYFAAALVALIAAEGLMAAGYGYPNAPVGAPQTLVLVHLVAIGWLSLLLCGSLFQFVPVLVARPLSSNSLPLPTLACLVFGLAALLTGFLQLAGQVGLGFSMFPVAAALLGAGFGLVLWNIGRTVWGVRPLALPARFVVVGLFCIGATVLFGSVFALVLGGVTAYPPFLNVAARGLPLHIVAGLGGWLTFTAMGVSYRLLAMFMLAPDLERKATRSVLYLGTLALTLVIVGGTALASIGRDVMPVLGVGGLLGLSALGLYGRDILHLYRVRKRRTIELNSRMAAVALFNLAASIVLIVILLLSGMFERKAAAVVFLVAFGWLSGLALAKLYKIVAFMTWLECYGPILGKTATPRVQDLVDERRASKWFWLYFLAVWSAAATLMLDQSLAFRVAAVAMAIATVAIVVQLLRTRRLADVQDTLRGVAGLHPPLLLLSRLNMPERRTT